MNPMRNSPVIAISDHQERSRRVGRAVAARRRLESAGERAPGLTRRDARRGGRVWVNGHELGGTDPRHAHLAASFD
jgi:hypothetical protein